MNITRSHNDMKNWHLQNELTQENIEQYVKGDYYTKSDEEESVSAGSDYHHRNDFDPEAIEDDSEHVDLIFYLYTGEEQEYFDPKKRSLKKNCTFELLKICIYEIIKFNNKILFSFFIKHFLARCSRK